MTDRASEFGETGFSIVRGLIPAGAIDRLLALYRRDLLPSSRSFYRQSTGRWERNVRNEHGYVQNSFLDIHDYRMYDEFSAAARDIYCSTAVQQALAEITGQGEHRLVQSMLFDQNTATEAHQDRYYLDSVPGGQLLAGWFALEDIDERAGRFFVVPGSHRTEFPLTDAELDDNDLYLRRIAAWMDGRKPVAPALAKGDVLFWSSGTVHGSLPTQDASFSRRSLTAHYLPAAAHFGNRRGVFPTQPKYGVHNEMRFARDTKTPWKSAAWSALERFPLLRRAASAIGKHVG